MWLKIKTRLMSAIFGTCVICATTAEFSVYATNYGTNDNYIIGEKGMAYINIVDEDGNYIDNDSGMFQICSASGDKIGQWRGNNGNSFYSTDYRYNVSSITYGGVSIGIDDLPDVLESHETPYYYKVGQDIIEKEGKSIYRFGNKFDVTVKYNSSDDDNTALVLPPHSFCVASDSAWTQKEVDWWFDIEKYKADNFHFQNLAGKCQIITMPDGDYTYMLRHTSGGSGNTYNKITISDKSSEYALKKIRLSDIYPSDFDSKGTHTHNFFGKIYNFNFGVDDKTNNISACMVFLSGNVVTAPIPDADGYVSVYVDKSTNVFYLMTDYFAGAASGGGSTGASGYPYRIKKFSFSTPSVPDQAIVLCGMDEGQYIVKALSLPDEYEAKDAVLTVGPASDGVPTCTLTAKRKKYSIKEFNTKNGTVTINDNVTQAAKGQKISLSAVPDKGYCFKEYRIINIWDDDFEIDKDQLNQNGIFSMPGEDTFVQGIFEVNYGDINLDNSIDASEMVLLRKYILSDETGNLPFTADINNNGKVNIYDYIRLMRILVSNDYVQ